MTENATTPTPETGNWNDQKSKLKAQFPTLSDADLRYDFGKKHEMLARVQEKIGKTKEELAAILSGF